MGLELPEKAEDAVLLATLSAILRTEVGDKCTRGPDDISGLRLRRPPGS